MLGEERASVGGFQIHTTIDPALQKTAEESVKKHLATVETRPDWQHQTYAQFKGVMADYRAKMAAGIINPASPRPKPEYLQGATLAIDNRDGGILAMVGGRTSGRSLGRHGVHAVRICHGIQQAGVLPRIADRGQAD
jgi:membrane peptidoglycan carboxypeptidase